MKRVILAVLLMTAPLMAVLPPLYQSRREIEALLSSPDLISHIPSGDVIEQILKVEEGYIILTNHRVVPVTVHYESGRQVGPARFTLEFHDAVPLK